MSKAAVVLAALLSLASAAQAQSGFYLRNGDRVVFYGDSITDQRLYTNFAEAYVVTRFPHLHVHFIHSGWGGDRVTGGGGGPIDVRLQRDVIAYKPTVMTIMLGMNDAGYKAFDPGLFQTYTAGYEHIIQTVKKSLPGIRITVIQPSPFDDVTRGAANDGYNAVLIRYGRWLKDLAQREGLTVADLNTPVVDTLKKATDLDPQTATKIIPDRVHPGPGGHLVMAEALLRAWNAPAIVAAVTIDGAARKVMDAQDTRVTDLRGDGALSWTELDGSLPLPIFFKADAQGHAPNIPYAASDPALALAVRSSDVVLALDWEPLRVTGLTADRYSLKIDGQELGPFTRDQLAEGVNLSTLPTPMVAQATNVLGLTFRHNDLHFTRWRSFEVPMGPEKLPHLDAALHGLDLLEQDVVNRQHEADQPVARHFELAPAG